MDDLRDLSEPQELTALGAAQRLAVHPDTIARAARAGDLPARWHFGRRLFAISDLEAWAASKAQRIGRRR